MNTQQLFEIVENHKETILAAERHIWNNPESGYREWKTHAYMKSLFEELGYCVTEVGNIPGFYVDVETGRPGPKVAIFAEMDALIIPTHPQCDKQTGAVHACGHHTQCAAMVGIAAALKAEGALDGLCGSIRLILVPAEEGIELDYRLQLIKEGTLSYISGKLEFLHRGILNGVDMALMVHASDYNGIYCKGGFNGCVVKKATFYGKSSHAASPQNGLNALYAANLALQAANSLRETFYEKDYIRFHPIITEGGTVVNAIPDRVCVESYLRGASFDALIRENDKVNRAFAASAAAMGCKLALEDQHGYAPGFYSRDLKAVAQEVAVELVGEDHTDFSDSWGVGCTDLGDICCVMPAIQPCIGGTKGAAHGTDFEIVDPYLACVVSAKYQIAIVHRLLSNQAERAKNICDNFVCSYPGIPAYLESLKAVSYQGPAVTYQENSITLTYHN